MHNLLPTSGFESLEHLEKAVDAMGPQRAQVVEMLKAEDKFDFTMRTPADFRDAIASRGFLNQHDTRRSGGILDPDWRAAVEASFTGLSTAEYQLVPNSMRPKYGYLRPAKGSGVSLPDNATRYGEDVFVFRHDAVKDEVTLYPDDSAAYSAPRGAGARVLASRSSAKMSQVCHAAHFACSHQDRTAESRRSKALRRGVGVAGVTGAIWARAGLKMRV
jgi:hypothetical protein